MLINTGVLINIPPPTLLEVAVQLLEILLRLWNAAEAQDRDNAIDALLLDLAAPLAGVVEVFNAHGYDLVHVLEAGFCNFLANCHTQLEHKLKTISKRGLLTANVLIATRLNAIHMCNLLSVAPSRGGGIEMLVREDVNPVTTTSADFDADASKTRTGTVEAD